MYKDKLKENLGKVVSVKTTAGIEIIALLLGFDEKKLTLTLQNPQLVVVTAQVEEENSVAVVPYTLTSHSKEIFILREQYLSVGPSGAGESAEDYTRFIADRDKPQSN